MINQVKLLICDNSASVSSQPVDTEFLSKCKISHDDTSLENLLLKEGNSIDVVVRKNCADDDKRGDPGMSIYFAGQDARSPT